MAMARDEHYNGVLPIFYKNYELPRTEDENGVLVVFVMSWILILSCPSHSGTCD